MNKYRDQFSLDSHVAYLNNGSFGAVPLVVAAAQRELQKLGQGNPNLFFSYYFAAVARQSKIIRRRMARHFTWKARN